MEDGFWTEEGVGGGRGLTHILSHLLRVYSYSYAWTGTQNREEMGLILKSRWPYNLSV